MYMQVALVFDRIQLENESFIKVGNPYYRSLVLGHLIYCKSLRVSD